MHQGFFTGHTKVSTPQWTACQVMKPNQSQLVLLTCFPPVSFVPSSLSFVATATRDKQTEFREIVSNRSLGLFIRLLVPDLKCLDSSQQLHRIFSSYVPMKKSCRHLWFIKHPGRICLYHRSQLSFKKGKIYMHECCSAGCQEILLIKRNYGQYKQNV